MHIWSKNEIENFAINAEVIHRYICKNKRRGDVSLDAVVSKIDEIVSDMKVDSLNGLTACIHKTADVDQTTAIENAVTELNQRWSTPYNIISGKNFFNRLSRWTQDCFDMTISARQVVPYFSPDEVPGEVARVINNIMARVSKS